MIEKEDNIKIEEQLANLLAEIYIKIPWNKIKVSNAHKFFKDNVNASRNTKDIKQFVDTLCEKVGVVFVRINHEYIDVLKENNEYAMSLVRKESIYLCNFALDQVDKLKERNKLAETGQKTLGE